MKLQKQCIKALLYMEKSAAISVNRNFGGCVVWPLALRCSRAKEGSHRQRRSSQYSIPLGR